jgi:hypothetical protein
MARRRGYLWLNWVNVRRRIEKGQRCGGRKIGSRNKATIERERTAILALERAKALEEAKAAGVVQELEEAKASGRKLMKEIDFDFAHVFAGLAEFYRPFPQWTVDPEGGQHEPKLQRGEVQRVRGAGDSDGAGFRRLREPEALGGDGRLGLGDGDRGHRRAARRGRRRPH